MLIKEDGTGLANANTYANVADAYHLPNSHYLTWTSASTTDKERALELATRFMDGAWQFNGRKLTTIQALQWPRVEAPDYDTGEDFASDALPADLVKATCEMAREAILPERAAARTDEGLLQMTITGALHLLSTSMTRVAS